MAQSKRNVSIQLIRIVAMFMIVTDHMLHYCNFPLKSFIIQITNSGVFIFLFISGFLFGQKTITNWKQWFLKRGIRVLIPFWIFILIDFIIEGIIWHDLTIKQVIVYVFNLQGIFGTRSATNPLWFLTLIMICYIITPVLSKLKSIELSKIVKIILIIVFFVIQMLCAYFFDCGMVYGHTIGWCLLAVGFYSLAFFVGDSLLKKGSNLKKLLLVTIVAIVTGGLVVVAHKYIDGTRFYEIISWYGYVVVDFWIISVVYAIGKTKVALSCKRVIDFFDGISYEFYLVHSLIINLIVYYLSKYLSMKTYILITLVLSMIGAIIIKYISKPIIKIMNKKMIEE